MSGQNRVKKRHDEILQLLEKQNTVTLFDLCAATGCSESTIRNDLTTMERQGLLRRTFGGAVQSESSQQNYLDINIREKSFASEKNIIAKYIVDNILRPNMTIVLDAGTSCIALAQEIARQRIPVAVMTNSFRAAVALSPALDIIDLYMFGGNYDPARGSLYDEYQTHIFKNLRADYFFMGADAIDEDLGITIRGFVEASMKQSMIAMASKTYVLADHSKFGRNAMKFVCKASEIAGIITDKETDSKMIALLQKQGVVICVAE